jgi:hypothetical protein
MTREEAFKTLVDNAENGYVDIEEVKLVFSELEQESCEDAISRETVKTEYKHRLESSLKDESREIDLTYLADCTRFNEFIDSIPPVNSLLCEDAVSKQMVKEQMIKYGFHAPDMTVTEFVEDLSFVNSQQPCEDAISRKSAVEAFQMFRNYNSNRSNKEWVNRIEAVLNQLPPVDSQPKAAYWIHHKETFDHAEHWECSQCHRTTMTNPFIVQGNDYNAMFYCPKCGVKMPECEE